MAPLEPYLISVDKAQNRSLRGHLTSPNKCNTIQMVNIRGVFHITILLYIRIVSIPLEMIQELVHNQYINISMQS